jgi:hypothetical protein
LAGFGFLAKPTRLAIVLWLLVFFLAAGASSSRCSAAPLPGRSQRAQQAAMPVIGFLNSQYLEGYRESLGGFRQGLK